MSLPLTATSIQTGPRRSWSFRPIRRTSLLLTLLLCLALWLFLAPSEGSLGHLTRAPSAFLQQHLGTSQSDSCSAPPAAIANSGAGRYAAQPGSNMSPANRTARPKAAFLALVRERQLHGMLQTMREIQTAFNDDPEAGYGFILLSETPFTDFFQNRVRSFLEDWPSRPSVQFGLVTPEMWDIPAHIDMVKAKGRWKAWEKSNIPYMDDQAYRQMCRFYSYPVFEHPLLRDLDYTWRIEPDTRHYCRYNSHWRKEHDGVVRWQERDPFRYMKQEGKKYAFVIAMKEFRMTVRTLYVTVNHWMKAYPQHIAADNLFKFVSDDGIGFNMCHFWTNYEIIDLSFVRSEAYRSFFAMLDKAGGFFYERWGDAPIRSTAAALMLHRDEVWHVDYAGYFHPPYATCPRQQGPGDQCGCDPHMSVDYDLSKISCKAKWDDAVGHNSTEIIDRLTAENGYPGFVWRQGEQHFVPPPARLQNWKPANNRKKIDLDEENALREKES